MALIEAELDRLALGGPWSVYQTATGWRAQWTPPGGSLRWRVAETIDELAAALATAT